MLSLGVLKTLINLEKTQDKMDTHIDFIENVYENVKHPLNFVTNKINNYISNEEPKQIETRPS